MAIVPDTKEIVLVDQAERLPPEEWERLLNLPLLETDGEPLESWWHRAEINLLIESTQVRHPGRDDYFVGGNMFIYFSIEQTQTRDYRGPDFFYVKGVSRLPMRRYWVTWFEQGRYPNLIIELLSPTTAKEDRTTKKQLYERTFNTREYFYYDPDTQLLQGWILREGAYEPLSPNENGWLWSKELGVWIGTWKGTYLGYEETWLRFYDENGQLVLIPAEAERQRAEAERQRAEAAEAELNRLKARLAELEKSQEG